MKKVLKNLTVASLALGIGLSFGSSQAGATSQPSDSVKSLKVSDLKIETVDGQKYSPEKHKKIAGIVVEDFNKGEKVSGFSTKQKFEAYSNQAKSNLKSNKSVLPGVQATDRDYFYDVDTSDSFSKSIGWSSNDLGSWNDRISKIKIGGYSWIILYYYTDFRNMMVMFSRNASTSREIDLRGDTGGGYDLDNNTRSIETGYNN
ncbi:MAG: hypothetical protein ACQEWT_21305 [Bacillota bacterium]